MKTLSLVIPAYNEEANIVPFLRRTIEVFHNTEFIIECIFVDDGSNDNTFQQISELINEKILEDCFKYRIKGIQFSRNFGKESAILAGLTHSSGEYITIIDADLQQDPEYAQKMVGFLECHEEYDAVSCYQKNRKEGIGQRIARSGFYKIVNRISDTHFEENASDFRTLRRNVVNAIINMPEYNRFSKGLFPWVGFKTYYMEYEVKGRLNGETKWTSHKLIQYAFDGFVGFSSAPLKVASYCGGLLAVLSFLYLVVVVLKRVIHGTEVPGYATIVSIMLFVGGMQMIFTGIIGEYLARMFMEVKRRPNYVIKDIISIDGTK